MSYPYQGGNPGYPQQGGYGQPPMGGGYPGQGAPQPGMPQPGGYPQPGGGYPQPGGGFQQQPGYPQQQQYGNQPGTIGMPTPESASAAAYGTSGGMPYSAQPGGGGGGIGFGGAPGGGAPMPGGPPMPGGGGYGTGAPPQTYGAPPAGYTGAPPPAVAMPGNYQQQQQPYQSAPAAPAYGSSPAYNQTAGYNQPPGNPGYSATAPGGYGASAPSSQPGGQPSYGSYGQPSGTAPPSSGGAMAFVQKSQGTVKPQSNFNAENDAQVLRKAMKGLGTDEKAIIDVLACRSNAQRQEIKVMFKTCFGRDLIKDLKSELGGHFEDVIIALMMLPEEFDAYEMKRAMKGIGTDEAALIEILCTRSNQQVQKMIATYKTMYHSTLEKDIISETSGHFKRLMVSMTAAGRQENQAVDMNKAREDAQRLYQAGAKKLGTDESTFNMVLASQSYEQLRAVFEEYRKVSGSSIEQAIKSEMSGDLETGMLAIVSCVQNRAAYFAKLIYKSMKGLGTDDKQLIRAVVSRCEVDMVQIKSEFQRMYNQSLDAFIRDDTSGDYRKVLLALVSQGGY